MRSRLNRFDRARRPALVFSALRRFSGDDVTAFGVRILQRSLPSTLILAKRDCARRKRAGARRSASGFRPRRAGRSVTIWAVSSSLDERMSDIVIARRLRPSSLARYSAWSACSSNAGSSNGPCRAERHAGAHRRVRPAGRRCRPRRSRTPAGSARRPSPRSRGWCRTAPRRTRRRPSARPFRRRRYAPCAVSAKICSVRSPTA